MTVIEVVPGSSLVGDVVLDLYESVGFSESRDFGKGTLRAFVRFG